MSYNTREVAEKLTSEIMQMAVKDPYIVKVKIEAALTRAVAEGMIELTKANKRCTESRQHAGDRK